MPSTEQRSQLSIRNNKEGYKLNGVLTVKDVESRSVWVLCHGLCSSCEGTVPRFVSDKLDANTFRQASHVCPHLLSLLSTRVLIIYWLCVTSLPH